MTIPLEAVEAALTAWRKRFYGELGIGSPPPFALQVDAMTAALTAAEPFIRAAVIEKIYSAVMVERSVMMTPINSLTKYDQPSAPSLRSPDMTLPEQPKRTGAFYSGVAVGMSITVGFAVACVMSAKSPEKFKPFVGAAWGSHEIPLDSINSPTGPNHSAVILGWRDERDEKLYLTGYEVECRAYGDCTFSKPENP